MMRTRLYILLGIGLMSLTVAAEVPAHIAARFVQTRTVAMLTEEVKSTGRFTFDQPDQVTWTYDNGMLAQLPKEMMTFIRKAVTGDYLQENPEFAVAEKDGTTILTPKRRQIKQFFKEIHIRLNKQTGIAEEVVLYEATGDITHIKFTDIDTH